MRVVPAQMRALLTVSMCYHGVSAQDTKLFSLDGTVCLIAQSDGKLSEASPQQLHRFACRVDLPSLGTCATCPGDLGCLKGFD